MEKSWLGYGAAKHAVIAQTRGFQTVHPNIYEAEGIQCFALAPWAIETDLVA